MDAIQRKQFAPVELRIYKLIFLSPRSLAELNSSRLAPPGSYLLSNPFHVEFCEAFSSEQEFAYANLTVSTGTNFFYLPV